MTEITADKPVLFAVDDDPLMLEYIACVAPLAGYIPQTFDSVKKMLERLDECPETIILDISMPDLDGFQAIDVLSERGFAGRLIIASGFYSDVIYMAEMLAKKKKLNLVGKLSKPFAAVQLQDLLVLPVRHPAYVVEQGSGTVPMTQANGETK